MLNQSHTHITTCSHTQPITYTHDYIFSYSTNHIHTSLHVLVLNQSHARRTSLHVLILNQSQTHITTCSHNQPITYTHHYMFSYSTNHMHAVHHYMSSYSTNHKHTSLHVLIINQSHTHITTCSRNQPITKMLYINSFSHTQPIRYIHLKWSTFLSPL